MNFKALIRNPRAYAESLTLRDAIGMAKELDRRYHEDANSPVPDEVYDVLVKVIAERSPNNPYLRKVGSSVKSGQKVRLDTPMPSLDKRFPGTPELKKFLRPGTYVLSDKKDGNSLTVGYTNRTLSYARTRGDGVVGQDVSGICPALNVPTKLAKGVIEVRCEMIMQKDLFATKYHKREVQGRTYKSARNMVAGLTKRNEASKFVRDTDVYALEILKGYGADKPLSQQFKILKSLGFTVVPHKVVENLTEAELIAYYGERKKKAHYEIDGIVVARDVPYKRTADNPKHAVAFKINSIDDAIETKVTGIEWTQSRHNKLVPVIHIEPVEINGAEVAKITGHNFFFIQNGFRYKDRAKNPKVMPINKGAIVKILRRGEVIPHVEEVVRAAKMPAKPDVDYKVSSVNAIAVQKDASKERKILHFFTTLEVEGIKLGTIRKLEEAGLNTISKILKAGTEDFMRAEGIQHTTALTLYRNIKKLKSEGASFAKLGHASGVFGDKIGEVKLQAVYDTYPRIVSLASKDVNWLTGKLEQVAGLKTLASTIAVKLPKFVQFLERTGLKVVTVKIERSGNAMDGKVVLFTSVRDKDLAQWIVANGGRIASTVKQANVLIVKDKGASNTKIDYAKQNSIPLFTVEGFRRKYGIL